MDVFVQSNPIRQGLDLRAVQWRTADMGQALPNLTTRLLFYEIGSRGTCEPAPAGPPGMQQAVVTAFQNATGLIGMARAQIESLP